MISGESKAVHQPFFHQFPSPSSPRTDESHYRGYRIPIGIFDLGFLIVIHFLPVGDAKRSNSRETLSRLGVWRSSTVKSHSVWRFPVFEYCYSLVVDGGALNQGSADSAGYGSFRLEARTGQKQTIRLDFGRGVTNNEAEYRTLIAGLKDLVGRIQRAGKSPSGYSLLVHTDSQLVVGQAST